MTNFTQEEMKLIKSIGQKIIMSEEYEIAKVTKQVLLHKDEYETVDDYDWEDIVSKLSNNKISLHTKSMDDDCSKCGGKLYFFDYTIGDKWSRSSYELWLCPKCKKYGLNRLLGDVRV